MPLQSCRVTFTDKEGVEHEVEVQAESVFEAAALALRSFRRDNWSAEQSHWTGVLEVFVQPPAIRHKVVLEKLYRFLEAKGGSPRDMSAREKLSAILDGK